MMISDVAGRRVTVMGLGRFGGGLGVTRWLLARGAEVLLTDREDEGKLADALAELAPLRDSGRLSLRWGAHNIADFRDTDLVVANPAVKSPWSNKYLNAATGAGVPITSEIRLLLERVDRKRVIGITGTAGKSTTTSMIHHLLVESGHRAHKGGNLGGSLLDELDTIEPNDWLVVELSSSMLYWLGAGVGYADAPGISPHVAVLTNLEPNHLDWHGTFEHYRDSKENIFRYQVEGDHRVTQEAVLQRRELPLKLPGAHNQLNGLLAMQAVLRAANIFPPDAAPKLATFSGLPHRLQLVADHDGRRFFNDSKSTTPQATVLAVQAFKKPSTIHLIAGGYDKQVDLSSISALTPKLAGLYTIGATGTGIADLAMTHEDETAVGAGHVEHCETLDRAVASALARMEGDHLLLLSPGCASWDQFDNFEQRGEQFAELARSAADAGFSQSQECENVTTPPRR